MKIEEVTKEINKIRRFKENCVGEMDKRIGKDIGSVRIGQEREIRDNKVRIIKFKNKLMTMR